MIYSPEEQYEDSSKLFNEQHDNHVPRSVKAVKSTRSRIMPQAPLVLVPDDHDYDEPSCPSFDLHLYAHIDRSSLNRCVFTPIPHQTDDRSHQIARKRKFESADSANEHIKSTKFGNDHGELADIIYNMDIRLDELTRTCNGLRSNIHTLTKMVTKLVNNQTQNTSMSDHDDMSQMELPYVRSSSTSKTTSNRNKRLRSTDMGSQRPTEFLCRLIRKVYSINEIVAGITADERLDRIKETIANRYFADDPERFETFWAREAHQSILGQARAQRCRDKKPEVISQIIDESPIQKSNTYRLVI